MSYERHTAAVEAADGKPDDAHQAIDVVRGSLHHLMDEGPGHFCWPWLSGDRPTTATTAYDEDSLLVRLSLQPSRPSRVGSRPRWWKFAVYATISGGATCAFRVVSAGWRLPDDPPIAPDLEAEDAGFTSGGGAWGDDMTLQVTPENGSPKTYGIPADEPAGHYDVIYLALEGRVTAGAGTITVHAMAGKEIKPT